MTDFANVPNFVFGAPGDSLLTSVYLAQLQGCNHKVYTFPSGGPPALDLDQHGLTGSWYEAATGGQGVEVEVFPNEAPGTGSALVIGSPTTRHRWADHQRWYRSRPAVAGQPSASLTIYQNAGGNFDAPPATGAQAVGTATLSFDTCSSGRLSTRSPDGTGRTGTMPLTRLTQNMTCSTTDPAPLQCRLRAVRENGLSVATSGQGLTAEGSPICVTFFAAWYTYTPNGGRAGASGQRCTRRKVPLRRACARFLTIYETTGGMFDTPTPAGQQP